MGGKLISLSYMPLVVVSKPWYPVPVRLYAGACLTIPPHARQSRDGSAETVAKMRGVTRGNSIDPSEIRQPISEKSAA